MKKEQKNTKNQANTKSVGNAKGKASFDQNGQGNSPKYGEAGRDPSQTKTGAKTGKL